MLWLSNMAKYTCSFALLIFLFFLPCSLCLSLLEQEEEDVGVPAMFAFGDSIFANGNNFYFPGAYDPAVFLPYGLDFVDGPTGRFTNNKTLVDALGELLGLPLLPAFLNPNTTGLRILRGVNYASAGAGILDATLSSSYSLIPLRKQVEYFATVTLPQLRLLMKSNNTVNSYLSESIFAFSAGGVDYYSCFENRSETECSSIEFAEFLVKDYIEQLKRVYNAGGRKFVLFGLQVLGCTPQYRGAMNGTCVEVYNVGATNFNEKLRSSIDDLNQEMPGSGIVFFDSYNVIDYIAQNPSNFGLEVVNESCCPRNEETEWLGCIKFGPTCEDRKTYLYFDGGHMTDVVNAILANAVYSAENRTTDIVYPYNVKSLVSLRSRYVKLSVDQFRHFLRTDQ